MAGRLAGAALGTALAVLVLAVSAFSRHLSSQDALFVVVAIGVPIGAWGGYLVVRDRVSDGAVSSDSGG